MVWAVGVSLYRDGWEVGGIGAKRIDGMVGDGFVQGGRAWWRLKVGTVWTR